MALLIELHFQVWAGYYYTNNSTEMLNHSEDNASENVRYALKTIVPRISVVPVRNCINLAGNTIPVWDSLREISNGDCIPGRSGFFRKSAHIGQIIDSYAMI